MKTRNILERLLLGLALVYSTPALAQTDLTNSAGTMSAQYTDSPQGEDLGKLVDNLPSTKYLTFHATGWVQFKNATPAVVTKYALTSANDADERDPKSWTFQGSTDGNTWATLNTQTNQDFPTRFLRKEYSFANSTAYSYYRLQATNNSGTILQLAEWEIYGQVAPTTVATVYKDCSYGGYAVTLAPGDYTLAQLVAKGVVNNDISSLKVNSGYEVALYPDDNFQGSGLTLRGDQSCLVGNNFNDVVSSLRVRTTTSTDGWENFRYPEIVFQDKSPSHPGSKVFHTAIPDPVAAMRAQVLALVKKLHYNTNDNIRSFTKLIYTIEDYDGVASKSGSGTEIYIRVSTRHLQNIFNQTNGSYEAIRTEILGILSHEGTHGYQYEPRNAGSYSSGTEFYGFIEGVADAVRISVGLHPGRRPQLGGTWRDGYTTSGFFIHWMVLKKDPNFLIKFQHTARTFTTWSWDGACRQILGVGVQPLWDEYQTWIRNGRVGLRAAKGSSTPGMEQYSCAPSSDVVDRNSPVPQAGEAGVRYTVFANPGDNTLRVQSATPAEISALSVYSVAGRLVRASTGAAQKVDISGLANGLYFVVIQDSKGAIQKEKVLIYR